MAVADIRADGVVIIEDLFVPEVMDELLAAVSDELNAQDPGDGDFFGNSKRSVNALFAHGSAFSE